VGIAIDTTQNWRMKNQFNAEKSKRKYRDDVVVCMRRNIVVGIAELLAAADERREERLHRRHKDRHADDLEPSHPPQETGLCRFVSRAGRRPRARLSLLYLMQ